MIYNPVAGNFPPCGKTGEAETIPLGRGVTETSGLTLGCGLPDTIGAYEGIGS